MILSCFHLYVVRCLVMSDMTMSPCLSYLHFRLDLLYSYSHVSQICTQEIWKKHVQPRKNNTHTQTLKVFKGLIRFHVHNDTFILLMEEILHHLGYINLVNNGINYISTGAWFLPSTVPLKNACIRWTFTSCFFLPEVYLHWCQPCRDRGNLGFVFEPGDLWGGRIQIFVGCVYNENCGTWNIIWYCLYIIYIYIHSKFSPQPGARWCNLT